MDRSFPIIDGIKCEKWTCQSATERDQQLSIYQNPPPSTHELAYKWLDDMSYIVGLRPKAVPTPATSAPAPVQPTATGLSLAEAGQPAHPLDAPAADLAKMKREDLKTIATENGIDLHGYLAANKQASNVSAAAFVKDAWAAKQKAGG
jgi:hypothetical protein